MDAGGSDGIARLQRVPSLCALAAVSAATHLDEEQPHARLDLGDVLFVLLHDTSLDVVATAIGATGVDRCQKLLVDVVGDRSPRLHAVVPAGLSTGGPGGALRGAPRERGGLPFAGAIRLRQTLAQPSVLLHLRLGLLAQRLHLPLERLIFPLERVALAARRAGRTPSNGRQYLLGGAQHALHGPSCAQVAPLRSRALVHMDALDHPQAPHEVRSPNPAPAKQILPAMRPRPRS